MASDCSSVLASGACMNVDAASICHANRSCLACNSFHTMDLEIQERQVDKACKVKSNNIDSGTNSWMNARLYAAVSSDTAPPKIVLA